MSYGVEKCSDLTGEGKAFSFLLYRRLLKSSGLTLVTDYKPALMSLYQRLEKLATIR